MALAFDKLRRTSTRRVRTTSECIDHVQGKHADCASKNYDASLCDGYGEQNYERRTSMFFVPVQDDGGTIFYKFCGANFRSVLVE